MSSSGPPPGINAKKINNNNSNTITATPIIPSSTSSPLASAPPGIKAPSPLAHKAPATIANNSSPTESIPIVANASPLIVNQNTLSSNQNTTIEIKQTSIPLASSEPANPVSAPPGVSKKAPQRPPPPPPTYPLSSSTKSNPSVTNSIDAPSITPSMIKQQQQQQQHIANTPIVNSGVIATPIINQSPTKSDFVNQQSKPIPPVRTSSARLDNPLTSSGFTPSPLHSASTNSSNTPKTFNSTSPFDSPSLNAQIPAVAIATTTTTNITTTSVITEPVLEGINMVSKYPFFGRHPDELSFETNEPIKIISAPIGSTLIPSPGWCIAYHPRTKKIGLCPLDYLEYPPQVPPAINASATAAIPIQATTVMASQDIYVPPPLIPAPEDSVDAILQTFSAAAVAPPPPPAIGSVAVESISSKQISSTVTKAASASSARKEAEKRSSMRFSKDLTEESTGTDFDFRYGKLRGYATDIIVIRGHNGELEGTSFHVRFSGSSADAYHIGDDVRVFVNGEHRMSMKMSPGGVVTFKDGTLKCPSFDKLLPEEHGIKTKATRKHKVRFEHVCTESSEPVRYCEALIYIWNVDDYIIVSDIDGTITKSDLGGMWNTTVMIKAGFSHNGYAHDGVCTLFQKLVKDSGCHIVYLTARPLDLIDVTRTYIRTLNQHGSYLPDGPIVTDRTNYMGSIQREVIYKTSHEFKTEMLLELVGCFIILSRDVIKYPVFVAGFGNKDTDAAAYDAAGIPAITTFVVDTKSNIRSSIGLGDLIRSYHDPKLEEQIVNAIELIKAGKLPQPPTRRRY